ncbi:MAG: glycosyltransferase family 4 protein [Desulfuromonadales bacterium]|nr:glycosyltransferase family 4 protein [Desulfuromonadales bacterium]
MAYNGLERFSVALVAPYPPPYGGMSMQAQKLRQRLEEEGVPIEFIPSNPRFTQLLTGIERVPGIRTLMRTFIYCWSLSALKRVQIVHIFGASHLYFFLVVAPAIVAGKLFGKKVVVNYRGGEAESFLNKWGKFVLPFLKMADVLAVPSPFLQEVFEQCQTMKPVMLPNLADIEKFNFRERKELRPKIVVSRQLEPIYNHECILKAFRRIKKHYPEAVLRVAGGGSEEAKLKALVKEFCVEGVEFLGALSHDQLAAVYDDSDIMINASRADNFPGSILEAFLCGIPVVTTTVGGIPYMVKDGETGILVGPDNDSQLAEGACRLLEDPTLAKNIAANARRYAEGFGWSEVKKKLFILYGISGPCPKGA